jgi:hypothetical protein
MMGSSGMPVFGKLEPFQVRAPISTLSVEFPDDGDSGLYRVSWTDARGIRAGMGWDSAERFVSFMARFN